MYHVRITCSGCGLSSEERTVERKSGVLVVVNQLEEKAIRLGWKLPVGSGPLCCDCKMGRRLRRNGKAVKRKLWDGAAPPDGDVPDHEVEQRLIAGG